MLLNVLKAIVVGIAASIPVGPIAILVIQKTLCKGFKPGFVTSLGATVVDTLFAVVAIFALAVVQNFIEGNPIPIFIGGGLIVIALGLSMTLSNPFRKMKTETKVPKGDPCVTDFLSACAMGISNPGAIAVMLTLMAFFGIAEDKPSDWTFFPIILGIAGGSLAYWLGVTALLNKFRRQFNMRTLIWINRSTGAVVIVLGLATLAEGLIRIFN